MKTIITLSLVLMVTNTFSQQWNTSGDNYTTGKLGIGFSSSPTYDLDISRSTPYLRLHSSIYSVGPSSIVRKGGIIFGQENGDKTAAMLFAVPPQSHVPGILFATKEAWNLPGPGATDWYDRMFIHPNGNVGIGTIQPANTLHVEGTMGLNGSTTLPSNAEANNSSSYVNRYNFKLSSSNNGFYIALSNTFNERKVFLQSGHREPGYAYGTGTLCLNPFGGNVGIGTPAPDAALAVKGDIHAREVRVDLTGALEAPDYVFAEGYELLPLAQLERYIKENKHLPGVPSATEMEENGLNLKEMNLLLLKKVEELTLHLIDAYKISEKQVVLNQHLQWK